MKDEIVTTDKWSFNGDVTEVFDDMLERSIPQYEIMRETCFTLACKYVQPKTEIVDLGCSRGEAMSKLVDKYGAQNHFTGIEVSKPMLEVLRKRFQGYINCNVVSIKEMDLRREYPPVNASVTLAVLTIQFTPIEYRLRILSDIYKNTMLGGAFIFVEKVLGATADIDKTMVDEYYDLKRYNGYTEEQIQRKRMSLEGVLVPVTAKWNEELLRMSGWSQIDCFWRWMNFAGWIAIK